jgi:hypothetical protein
MGYTTDFEGEFNLDRPLAPKHKTFLEKFSETRRMKRDVSKIKNAPTSKAADLELGPEGAYFVDGDGFHGQQYDESVVERNFPPVGQPGLWCQWVPTSDETIGWDGGEKFYYYKEWLNYIIDHFLEPWNYVLNGECEWFGEDSDDRGKIIVKDNKVTTKTGRFVYD